MLALCKRLVPTPDEITLNKWGTVGLLHDADYEQTKDTPEKHTLLLEQELGDKLDGDVVYAIKSHNFLHNGVAPQSIMDWSIYACDELSGLIIAATLVHPDKRLSSVDASFIMNRFQDPSFAKGADRDQIRTCETKLNIPLSEFIQMALFAMQGISAELNL
jgi:predicted hydrolase (HD superfamily)